MPPKILKSAAEIVKDAIKTVEAEKKAGKTKEILESQTPPATTPRGGPLLPRSQGMYPPDVPQVDLPRQKGVDKARAEGKKPKYTERMQSLLDSPTVRKKVDKLIAKGQDLGMKEWYGTEPLRQVALDVISPQQYESLMAQLASASQRNPVDQQNLMGSYLYYLQQQGRLDPDALLLTNKLKEQGIEGIEAPLIELPEGYGSLAQSAIFNRGKQIAAGDIEGALPPEKKLGTFYRNLLGNLQPVTVDVNAVRGPVIEAGDPRWLTSKLVEKDEAGKVKNVYFPRQMVEEGKMSVREAKERPGFWEVAPSGSEYAGFEDLWQRAARREGVKPAEAQALGWYGSGDVTALKTKPEVYIENLERLLNRTADVTGKSPLEVLRQFLKGEEFLRKAEGGSIDLEAEYLNGGAVMMKRGGKAKGKTLASMDTGMVEMGRAPGAEKAERILSGAAELLPGVAAGKSAIEGEYQKALIEAGLDVAGGPLAKGLGAVIPAVAGIFIGPKSRLWNKEGQREWERLINAGVNEKEAYQKTGTFMGADGNLRQEISDQSMKMRSPEDLARLMDEKSRQAQAIKASMGYGSKQRDLFPKELTEARKRERPRLESLEVDIKALERDPEALGVPARLAVDHPKLFEAYPELGDVMVRQNVDLGPGVYGSVSLGVEPKISLADPRFLDKEFAAPEDTMIHELQHLVQMAEGFEGGSAAQDAINMVGRARVRELMDQGMPKNEALDQAREEFKGRAGELYNRMAGEAEARAVEARRPMSSEELLQNFPPEQQYRDFYPYEEQLMQRDYPPVLLYNNGGPVKMADGGDLEEEYNLRKMGMDPARVRGGYERKPLSRAEIQAMMLDVPAGIGVPFAEAGSYALRGKTDEAKESAAIEAALIGVPGAAVLAKPAYQAVKKGVKKAAPAARDLAREFLESGMESGLIQGPAYAVKPTGGQWLGGYKGDPRQIDVSNAPAGTSEDVVQAYKDRLEDAQRKARQYTEMSGFEPTQAMTDRVRGLQSDVDRIEQENAVRRWVDSNLNNYVRKQMGTPDDPVLKLAEQGILHMPYQETGLLRGLAAQREKAGFPAEGLATTDLGRMWETMSDRNIASIEAGKLTDPNYLKDLERRAKENDPLFNARPGRINDEPPPAVMTPEEARDLQRFKYMNYPPARANAMEENQWLSRVDPETPIYSLSDPFGGRVSGGDLGFDHIVDVLKADLAAGRIRPEQLSKMSMEQAVRRTHEYDLERAAAMAKAAEEEMAGLSVAKSFDDGFKIVQLNKPGQFAKESDRMGHSVRGYEPSRRSEDWTEASGVEGSSIYGHGGWEAIKSGEAQVFSIRDAKNQPHVTIELGAKEFSPIDWVNSLSPEEKRKVDEALKDVEIGSHSAISRVIKEMPEYQAAKAQQPKVITQIKGKQNRKPDENYLPYVQQFIREGNYEIAGDLRNSGLIDLQSGQRPAFVPTDAPRYVTQAELDRMQRTGKFEPDFKKGGRVKKQGEAMSLERQFQNAMMGLKSPLKGERRYDQGGFVQAKLFNGLPFNLDALYAERQAIMREQGTSDPRYIERIWSAGPGTDALEVQDLKNRLSAAAGYSPSELKKLDNVEKMIGSVITRNRTPEMDQALRQIVANEQKHQEALRSASEANKLKQDKTIDPQVLQREQAKAKLGVMQSAADLNKSMGAFFGTDTFDKIEPSSQYRLDRDEMNLLGVQKDPVTQEYVPQRMATRTQSNTSAQSGIQAKNFNGAPFNAEAFEAERQAIMREYGFNLAQMATAYNGSGGQPTGLSKGEEDAIAERLINAAGYTRQEFNALPNVRAVLGSAITTGGIAEANQIRDRVAREQEQYQSALNWMKTPEQRLGELVDYLEGRSESYGSTPGMPQWEFESLYLQPIRENPENLQRFIEDVKLVQERQKRESGSSQISEKEMAAKKLFAWQRAQDLNSTMESLLGPGNFEKVEPARLTAREMSLLGVVEEPRYGGYMTPEGKWYGESRILENILNDDVVPTIVGNLRSGYGAFSSGTPTPTPTMPVAGDFSAQVVVYGPDGTMYSSPAAAERVGIFNYTMTPPAKSTGNIQDGSGLITNQGPGMGLAPNLSTGMKGGTPPTSSGLITNQGPGMGLAPSLPNTGMPPLDLSAALTAITPTPVAPPAPRLNINPVVTPTIQTGTMTPTAVPQIDVQRIGRNLGAIPMRSGGAAIMKDGGRIKPDYKAALDMLFYQMRNKG